ncbi:T6SS phospholipase effector Tle1-like catalytic domain-containing protein [Marinobacter pelagius]|uniref:Uncharacterized alpha/beta hydrolase domain n=1 Tax=Marinobacter pelagius TaxID=379482 RepID=A0A1I4RBB9_9GAMM|nr:DUF2235 domain-containing protein [Marinobacter pelagius]SFM49495.1 Uncharacterized alpha/beta hydrolase domain [Marinobacter pelagius]
MHIKPFYRLRPADLPLVESPFLASQTLRRTLSDPLAGHSSLLLDDIPGVLPGTPREVVHQYLISRVATGELCLVHTGIGSDRPMSPVVSWRPDQGDGNSGAWHCESGAREIIGLEHSVSELNRKGLTPRDLSRAEGIGFRNYQGSPAESELNGGPQHENADRRLTLPLGASASVLPLAAESKTLESEGEPDGVHLVAGLFTDGTLNNVDNIEIFRKRLMAECVEPVKADPSRLEECRNLLAMRMGESYANGPTNVVKLFDLYDRGAVKRDLRTTLFVKAYEPGPGTKTGEEDSKLGAATGLGDTGVPAQVSKLFRKLVQEIVRVLGESEIKSLTLDLFGFSRGAAAARHASNEILKGNDGALARAMASKGLDWPKEVSIRFIGLFDTVAGILNLPQLDFSPRNDVNRPLELYLDPEKLGKVVHLVATDEKRANFSLNSVRADDGILPANYREIEMPGAHSDVGGGYPDAQTEELLLHPTLRIFGSRAGRPSETMEWDNLESLRAQTEAEGWIGEYSLPLSDGSKPFLEIEQKVNQHPSPDGSIELSLRMMRHVRGEYSRIGMHLMHMLAVSEGVPLKPIPENGSFKIPDGLESVAEEMKAQVSAGIDNLKLSDKDLRLVRQRYIHHSAHYNLMDLLVADQVLSLEVPAEQWFHPLRPSSSQERLVHFNRKPG